ncbi:glycerol-3-phosphate O-acyltransferase plsY [Vibrio ishigakensis]|uniref:Glycerol-3-phosphate O-acyltransferase plsY n=1 Tax=Vibrio ishigakensis TaxID=1481914 RepID=A0A0B8NV91_9VIBR|nr:glycerol-3-phosphate O-acyltransferase plsY [Vibrio ishigakensis]
MDRLLSRYRPCDARLIGIAACIGHIYPIFFHFKGGKGVATAIGAIAPIGWDLTGMLMALGSLRFFYSAIPRLLR